MNTVTGCYHASPVACISSDRTATSAPGANRWMPGAGKEYFDAMLAGTWRRTGEPAGLG
jgi:hypothetical protein